MGYNIAFKTIKLRNLIVSDRDANKVGGVYYIPVKFDNETLCYIGKTKRNLKKRIKEHIDSLSSIYGNSALKEFLLNNRNAVPLWENAKILISPPNLVQLDVHEKVQIWRHGDKCINQQHSRDLATLWRPILEYG